MPEDIKLRVGATASVLVMTGTSGSQSDKPVVAVPKTVLIKWLYCNSIMVIMIMLIIAVIMV